ncbi:YIP1 family protein [Corynebacterium pilosum]|nr:YIP1 family protein [Corynebacterium pilosum]
MLAVYQTGVRSDVDTIKPNQDSKRTIIKLNCNVEINDDKGDSPESSSFFSQFIKPLFRPHDPHLDVLIRSTARSAGSTHIEFAFPHGMHLKSIHAFSPTSTDKKLDYLEKERPRILKFKFDEARFTANHQNGSTEPTVKSQECVEEPFSQATDPKYRHGSYRSSFNRVHIQPNKKTSSLETLSFRLAPDWMLQPILAIITTFLSLIFSSTVFWRQTQGLEQSSQQWFTFAEFLASVTLLTALYGALFVTGNLHVVLRRAYSQPRYLIGASSVVGIGAPFLLVYYLYLGDDPQPSQAATRCIWGVLIVLWVVWARLAHLTFKFSQATKMDLKQFYQERVIPEKPSPRHHDRNVIAITETGMYDLDYLDENNLTALGISNDSDAYRKELAELGKGFNSQWRNRSAEEN